MDDDLKFRLKAGARRLNRLRWIAKLHNLRRYEADAAPLAERLRYVLWSSELGDFSFEIIALDEVAATLAEICAVTPELARSHLEEATRDQRLRDDYAGRRRAALLPRRMALSQRVIWWALVRLRRPSLVVETGVWYGLGSITLLRALELNAADGHDGELVSFDPDPTAGWLVPDRHRQRWTLVRGTTEDALEDALRGRQADLVISDTPSTYERERHEFEVALRHAAPAAMLVSGNGDNTAALPDLCDGHALAYRLLRYRSSTRIYRPRGIGLAITPGAR